jgi:hypothetical protein
VIDCRAGGRKHDIAEEHLKAAKVKQGLFLSLVGRAQARVWDAGKNYPIEPNKPMPYVNHETIRSDTKGVFREPGLAAYTSTTTFSGFALSA